MSENKPRWAGKFEAEADFAGLDVELAIPCRVHLTDDSTREILGALVRAPGREATWVEGWSSDEFKPEPAGLWEYFEDGGWNNGYSTEVLWIRIARLEEAPAVIEEFSALLHTSPENPSAPPDTPAATEEAPHATQPKEPTNEAQSQPN